MRERTRDLQGIYTGMCMVLQRAIQSFLIRNRETPLFDSGGSARGGRLRERLRAARTQSLYTTGVQRAIAVEIAREVHRMKRAMIIATGKVRKVRYWSKVKVAPEP